MKLGIIAVATVLCTTICGQTALAAQSFSVEASVSEAADGTLAVTARNPRPLWQTIRSVRLRYGWTVDYEDPLYSPQQLTLNAAHRSVLIGGTFVSHIHEPINNSSGEEQRVLQEIVDQYNAQSPVKYRVLKISDVRFDIAPATRSALDQAVTIDNETRSLSAEVDAIMAAFTKVTGIKVFQGGFVNNMMEQTQISLKHSSAVPVRQLLNEVLNRSPNQMVWLFTYEPNGGYFGVGFRTTEKWNTGQNNATTAKIFANPHFVPSQNE